MPPAGFEPAIPASERPDIHALDHAVTDILWFISQVHIWLKLLKANGTKQVM